MEQWLPVREFPGYSVSDEGRVRNDRFGKMRKINHTRDGNLTVAFFVGGRLYNRSLARVVAETFVDRPRQSFNTPIYIDGDKTNCRASNLAWRPKWFAMRYREQFRLKLPDYPNPVRNIYTGTVYPTVWDVVFDRGVLYNDVVLSIYNKTYVFPLYQSFEWVI
jgi:hypothetical protein